MYTKTGNMDHRSETPTQRFVARGTPPGGTYTWECSTLRDGMLEIVAGQGTDTVTVRGIAASKEKVRPIPKDAQITVTYTYQGRTAFKTYRLTVLRPYATIAFAGEAQWDEGVTYRNFYHQVLDQYGRVINETGMPCDEDCKYVSGTPLNKESPGTTGSYGPAKSPMTNCEYGNWPGGVAVLDTLGGWTTHHPKTQYHQKLYVGGWLTSPFFNLWIDPMATEKPSVWKDTTLIDP
jgi:hypothetical protein